MKRDGWKFEFAVDELRALANDRAKYHAIRANKWEKDVRALDKEMTDTARVEEQPVTGGVNRVLRYDPGLQAKHTTATQRRDSHRSSQRDYERWVLVLSREKAPRRLLKLDVADVAFFHSEMPE